MDAVDQNDTFQATETGFTVVDDGRLREYRDSDVTGIRIQTDRVRGSGEAGLTRERLEIRVQSANQVIRISNEYGRGGINLLAPFRDRLLDALAARSVEVLLTDGEVSGAGWTMSLSHFQQHQSPVPVPLQEINAAAWHGDEFCLWQGNAEEPFACFHRNAENTYLLARLIAHFVKDGVAPEESRGQLLSEFRDASPKVQTAMGTVGAVGLLIAAFCLKVAFAGNPLLFGMVAAAIVITALALWFIYIKFGKCHVLLHYEHALVSEHGASEQVLPMCRLASFAADWTEIYYNGIYHGTTVRFCFYSEGAALPSIEHLTQADRCSDKYQRLEALQSHASEVIARRMRRELDETGRVRWTSQLSIVRDGIEFRLRTNPEPQRVAFPQISRWKIENGKMKLWADGSWTATIIQHTNEENFYPGLTLIQQLGAQNTEQAARSDEQPAVSI